MKQQLSQILATLKLVETKGDSTVIMADCMKMLANVIMSIPDEKPQEEPKEEVEDE